MIHRVFLIAPGRRPDFVDIAEHLWGKGCDVDSDGNDVLPAAGFTELTITLRPGYEESIDIDPLDELEPLVLVIRSKHEMLAQKAAAFVHSFTGGTLSASPPSGRG